MQRRLVSFLQVRAAISGLLVVLLSVACVDRFRRIVANVRFRASKVRDLRCFHRIHGGQFATVKGFNGRVIFGSQMSTRLCLLQISRSGLRFDQVFLVWWKDGGYVRASELALANYAYRRCIQRLTGIRRGSFVHGDLSRRGERIGLKFLRFLTSSGALPKGGLQVLIQCLGASNSLTQCQNGSASAIDERTRHGVVLRSTGFKSARTLFKDCLVRDGHEASHYLGHTSFGTRTTRHVSSAIFVNVLFVRVGYQVIIFGVLRRISHKRAVVLRVFYQIVEFRFQSLVFFFQDNELRFGAKFFVLQELSPREEGGVKGN